MAQYRTISLTFWSDPFVEGLTAEEKVVFLYLFTNPQVNNLGISEVTSRKISFETGASIDSIESFLKKATAANKISVDGSKILCINFIKNQTHSSKNEKISQYLLKNLKELYDETSSHLASVLSAAYPAFFPEKKPSQDCDGSVSIGSKEGIAKQENPTETVSTPSIEGQDTVSIPSQDPLHTPKIPSEDPVDTVSIPSTDRPRDIDLDLDLEGDVDRDSSRKGGTGENPHPSPAPTSEDLRSDYCVLLSDGSEYYVLESMVEEYERQYPDRDIRSYFRSLDFKSHDPNSKSYKRYKRRGITNGISNWIQKAMEFEDSNDNGYRRYAGNRERSLEEKCRELERAMIGCL